MAADVLKNLIGLQEMPELIYGNDEVSLDDLDTFLTPGERASVNRAVRESLAMADMGDDDLHVFFHRAAHGAIGSRNRTSSFLGTIRNAMTVTLPGFAEVPGRVLQQARLALGEGWTEHIPLSANWWVRADVLLAYRDRFAARRQAMA